MTIRSDISINWDVSPRIITVASGSNELTIQDLHDTCRYLESRRNAVDNPYLIDTAGREFLGGTTYVGLTATLRNAVVAFEARPGPEWELCQILGGNLVAIDDAEPPNYIDPRKPTAYTSVDRTASSSATLTEQAAIQYSSFNGGVTVDITSLYTGTEYPVGTPAAPVNNLADAHSIADERGFLKIFIVGNITVWGGVPFATHEFIGESQTKSFITISSAAEVAECEFYDACIDGVLDGDSRLKDCMITTLDYVNGFVEDCVLASGTITLGGNEQATFLDCSSTAVGTVAPIIDMGGSGQGLTINNYNGDIEIKNKTGEDRVDIVLNSGKVILDSTVTAGEISVVGTGQLVDNSTGTTTVIAHYLTNPFNIRKNLASLIEFQRPHHTGTGDVYYWDPYGGDDTNDGVSEKTAFKTFAQTHNILGQRNHDIVICVPGDPSGLTTADEHVTITKDYVFVRGPGRDFLIQPTTDTSDSITVSGNGVEISGLRAATAAASTKKAINVDADFILLKDLWIEECEDGIFLSTGGNHIIENCEIHHLTGNGITLAGDTEHVEIKACHISDCDNDGIKIDTTGDHGIHIFDETTAHNSGGYGINIVNGESVRVSNSVVLYGNTLGDINDNGTNTHIDTLTNTSISDAVWADDSGLRALGLMQENYYIDQTSYTTYGGVKLMTSGRMRIYSDAASVGTSSNVTATYQITASWSGDEMNDYKVVKL